MTEHAAQPRAEVDDVRAGAGRAGAHALGAGWRRSGRGQRKNAEQTW
jgi:hypothetical protein